MKEIVYWLQVTVIPIFGILTIVAGWLKDSSIFKEANQINNKES